MPNIDVLSPTASELLAAVAEAKKDFAARNPRSAEQLHLAASSMPGGNTRSVLFYDPYPLTMVRGKGCTLWDLDGHRYDDFLGEFTAGLYGHSDEKIAKAVLEAMAEGLNLSGHNTREAELAGLICNLIQSIDLIRFTNSGTEANLMALALAKAVTGKSKVIVFSGAYHGSILSFPSGASSVINVPHDFLIGPYNDPDGAAALIKTHRADLCAVLVEPMQGAGGCIPGDLAFLSALRDETKSAGALLVFDEVMTSRLAFGGRQSQLGILPDLTVLGKYFGGGLPFGAFGGRADLMSRFDPREKGSLAHPGTFNNNTLTMAAGIAGLKDRLSDEAIVTVNEKGDRLRAMLNTLFHKHSVPMQVTGLGSVMNIHTCKKVIKNVSDLASTNEALKELFFFDMLEKGIYLARRGLVALSLPIGDGELARFEAAVKSFIDRRGKLLY